MRVWRPMSRCELRSLTTWPRTLQGLYAFLLWSSLCHMTELIFCREREGPDRLIVPTCHTESPVLVGQPNCIVGKNYVYLTNKSKVFVCQSVSACVGMCGSSGNLLFLFWRVQKSLWVSCFWNIQVLCNKISLKSVDCKTAYYARAILLCQSRK